MIPSKIRPYFKTSHQRTAGDNVLIEGMLTCCNSHEFEVRIAGEVKSGLFTKAYLSPVDDKIALEVSCKKCGKVISVFDSSLDGYDKCENRYSGYSEVKPFVCKKCSNSSFSVFIKYEYPDIQELTELGIIEKDNAFTWIWITLKCNSCGTKFSNFIDCETG